VGVTPAVYCKYIEKSFKDEGANITSCCTRVRVWELLLQCIVKYIEKSLTDEGANITSCCTRVRVWELLLQFIVST